MFTSFQASYSLWAFHYPSLVLLHDCLCLLSISTLPQLPHHSTTLTTHTSTTIKHVAHRECMNSAPCAEKAENPGNCLHSMHFYFHLWFASFVFSLLELLHFKILCGLAHYNTTSLKEGEDGKFYLLKQRLYKTFFTKHNFFWGILMLAIKLTTFSCSCLWVKPPLLGYFLLDKVLGTHRISRTL